MQRGDKREQKHESERVRKGKEKCKRYRNESGVHNKKSRNAGRR
jgi:hypothetical protein